MSVNECMVWKPHLGQRSQRGEVEKSVSVWLTHATMFSKPLAKSSSATIVTLDYLELTAFLPSACHSYLYTLPIHIQA